jgi:hypothetical protein
MFCAYTQIFIATIFNERLCVLFSGWDHAKEKKQGQDHVMCVGLGFAVFSFFFELFDAMDNWIAFSKPLSLLLSGVPSKWCLRNLGIFFFFFLFLYFMFLRLSFCVERRVLFIEEHHCRDGKYNLFVLF